MKLDNYYFDVEERSIALHPVPGNEESKIEGYKAIVAPQQGKTKVISVVKNSYQLVRNRDLIEQFLEQIEKLNVNWHIDPSHSFVTLNRMRLQITFPNLYLQDTESDIPLSLFLHNSYNLTEGVRIYIGAIRSVCSNGMIFGHVLDSIYARHTSGFTFDRFNDRFYNTIDELDGVQDRIDQLISTGLDELFMEELQKALGKRRLQEIVNTDTVPDKSQWQLLNDITYYISHNVEKPKRADLQRKTSKVFQL